MTKRALGRGLEALLGSLPAAHSDAVHATPDSKLQHLPIDVMQRGKYQPRVDMRHDTLQDLAASIRAQGVVQPIVVRPIGAGRYEIIAGERRWRAAQMAGLHDIPAVVRSVTDAAAVAMALIENIQREALNPLEEAQALNRLIEEFSMTHEQAAQAVGRSRAAVSNLLRLLELTPEVTKLLEEGRLEMGHARALLAVPGAAQVTLARDIVTRQLSVRQAEALVRRARAPTASASGSPPLDPDIRALQESLSQRLGAPVRLQHSAQGKGTLTIHYNSLDELDGILAHVLATRGHENATE